VTSNDESPLELAAMIEALRDSLETAQAEGKDRQTRFRVDSIEVEATVEVTKGREGGGGVKFYVVQAGGRASSSNVATQRIKLSMSTDPDLRIARRR
jgi:Trypsin-co-occurring domain 2